MDLCFNKTANEQSIEVQNAQDGSYATEKGIDLESDEIFDSQNKEQKEELFTPQDEENSDGFSNAKIIDLGDEADEKNYMEVDGKEIEGNENYIKDDASGKENNRNEPKPENGVKVDEPNDRAFASKNPLQDSVEENHPIQMDVSVDEAARICMEDSCLIEDSK